jgi:hypothetical protein
MPRTPSPFAPFPTQHSKPTSLCHLTHIGNVPAASPFGFLARYSLQGHAPTIAGNPETVGFISSKMNLRFGQNKPEERHKRTEVGLGWCWPSKEEDIAESENRKWGGKETRSNMAELPKEVMMDF